MNSLIYKLGTLEYTYFHSYIFTAFNLGFEAYVLLPYIIYDMESGLFSQSPAFLKRAGYNVEETTFYTATAIFHCTFYPALLTH